MPLPDSPVDFTAYDAAKESYNSAEANYKESSGSRDTAQTAYDEAKAALDAATAQMTEANTLFQMALSKLVGEADKVGVPYPPETTP